ncbi:Carboxymuconolactone decarboxylase family protein [Posidoniimonas polymericola]|uniref:Carboxymuconolactone decarboxylase family protein n=1 Tax=Posidoniimonas polymericola TaxID=2528002 RepID=A0A5C5ZEZ3_9BACT|nr:peroxidase-related enzyme [Posidoniimonas polymericola]TWT85710.1 Carboxymuconolactone decarboxylase family protein [Posidoniimonas polymericola]
MSRLPLVASDQANATQAALLQAVQSKLGRVPNLLRGLANSSAALRGYLDLSAALGADAMLTAHEREVIALAVAEANGCEYCLAAHTAIGKSTGMDAHAITAARRASGGEPTADAVAKLAAAVVATRGRVSDDDLNQFRAAGFDDAAVAEVVAAVALNTLTNYFNNLAQTEVDFPVAAPLEEVGEAAACTTACGCSV